jgi:probable selenium-dependent hydroxylase accessory protein YqeC
MKLSKSLELRRGVTALIGGGGKTSLMVHLARELGEEYTVICCTTTKIWPPAQLPVLPGDNAEEIRIKLEDQRVICLGIPNGQGKLTAPVLPMERLCELADFVLVEADGAAGHPLKAHAPYEPVLPDGRNQTILVVGADGFGRTVIEAAHRPERYATLAECGVHDIVTPTFAVRVMEKEHLHDRVYINQIETQSAKAAAGELAKMLTCPVVCGSLQKQIWWEG